MFKRYFICQPQFKLLLEANRKNSTTKAVEIQVTPEENQNLQSLIRKIQFCQEENLPIREYKERLKQEVLAHTTKERDRKWIEKNM